jgi:peptidoglycan/xylan/chitin deacetylase (PgdA/CDA1 family)
MAGPELFPALVISLDFELHWGVSEHVAGDKHPYISNLYGAREAVPRLLKLFEKRNIHASWAIVGKLFARGKEDLEVFTPSVLPKYERESLDTYRLKSGYSEEEAPLYFAPSLIKQIRATPGQEIACHTFCHYYCDEPGQDKETFRADLKAAQAIAVRDGLRLRSLVFPRNQIVEDYLTVLPEEGMNVYRGNPAGEVYHTPKSGLNRHLVRVLRLADSYLNLTGENTFRWSNIGDKPPYNIQASRFLRPYSSRLWMLEPVRRRRIINGLRKAAKRGEIFHLWWHPHNFGANQKENFATLNEIFDEFERLRERYGMQSLNMNEAAKLAHG